MELSIWAEEIHSNPMDSISGSMTVQRGRIGPQTTEYARLPSCNSPGYSRPGALTDSDLYWYTITSTANSPGYPSTGHESFISIRLCLKIT
jgi:hypothetical protein